MTFERLDPSVSLNVQKIKQNENTSVTG